MASSPKESRKVIEGVFAIHKPQWHSSAGVLRDLQTHFQTSPLFAPWLTFQRRNMLLGGSKKKHIENLKVKLGHGGTLDPLATGVLIVGVGKGTKQLGSFLECTKTYECVVLFGAATDSYDAVGKIVGKKEYAHVTKDLVEEKLAHFRGKISQKPSIFSALKVDGKKMYEYARAGGDVPEVAARPVEVHELKLVEWLQPGGHEYKWPEKEAGAEEKEGAGRLMGIREADARKGRKRSRSKSRGIEEEDHVENAGNQPKRPRTDSEPAMSGALPVEDTQPTESTNEQLNGVNESATSAIPQMVESQPSQPAEKAPVDQSMEETTTAQSQTDITPQPPAARLRMTVSSGFYVRSLCHDLGLACDSVAFMSSLVRSRQGGYELGNNVLEYSELEAGPGVWEPKIQSYLEDFMRKEGWEAEDIEPDESWEANNAGRVEERKENDRYRSYQGSKKENGGWHKNKGKGTGNWRGKGGGNNYSRSMNGGRD